MKTIIAGSRTIKNYYTVDKAIKMAFKEAGIVVTEVVCGGARGVDLVGAQWAAIHHLPVKMFPADWRKYGKGAGPVRNTRMAKYAEALIAIWDGESPGTKHMITVAKARGLKVHVYMV